MRWVGKKIITEIQSKIVAIDGYLQYQRVIFVFKNIFPFPLAKDKLTGDVLTM
jgi:hypothetical protein